MNKMAASDEDGIPASVDTLQAVHRWLYQALYETFTEDEFGEFKDQLKAHKFRPGVLEKLKNMRQALDAMESRGLVKLGHYDIIKTICQNLGKDNLAKNVDQAQARMSTMQQSDGSLLLGNTLVMR